MYELPGGYELASLGYSTPTPWHTPRELTEEELGRRLDALVARLREPEHAVFNFHCPPHGTHLDLAPLLDGNLRPLVDASGVRIGPVGSESVRRVIEATGPAARAARPRPRVARRRQKLGRTVCINPGSEYGDGILRGAIVDLDRDKGVARWQIVQG